MLETSLTVGLVQMNASNVVDDNLATATRLIREAATRGAKLILTPEMTTCMDTRTGVLKQAASSLDDNHALQAFMALAKELGVWLVIGSMAVKAKGDKLANRAFVIDDGGKVRAHYDKIHMFDVDLPNGESYRESDSYEAGSEAIVVETPWGGLGLSICYDLRFPDMYRQLAKAGATLLAIPAAFTKLTGEAHWHTLLTARAIENGAFVLAPAQVGRHANGRDTYGHSCVVDPWGRQILDAGTEIGVSLAALDLSEVERARERIPSLLHDRVMEVKRK